MIRSLWYPQKGTCTLAVTGSADKPGFKGRKNRGEAESDAGKRELTLGDERSEAFPRDGDGLWALDLAAGLGRRTQSAPRMRRAAPTAGTEGTDGWGGEQPATPLPGPDPFPRTILYPLFTCGFSCSGGSTSPDTRFGRCLPQWRKGYFSFKFLSLEDSNEGLKLMKKLGSFY